MSTAFQQTFNNVQNIGAPGGPINANSLINPNAQKASVKGSLSFAQEFSRMREMAASERDGFNPLANAGELQAELPNQEIKKHSHHNISALIQEAMTGEAEHKLKSMRDEDTFKEIKKIENQEESFKNAEELSSKYTVSEATKASVSQENQKQVTNAIKEGNVAQQESRHYEDGNSRKKQLANWEDLAPKIIEDPVNRAVRIDLPGVNDLETLIIRMNRDAVSIQAIGSKETMQRLHLNQTELIKNLQNKNVKMANLQVFDGELVRRKMAEKQGSKG